MYYSAVRILKFDSGHRVVNHESKCATLHGHEYKAHIYAQAHCLDNLGRAIDFSVIKDRIGQWIDDHWDHTMIIWHKDPNLNLLNQCEGYKDICVTNYNPTAENMAKFLIDKCNELLCDTPVTVSYTHLTLPTIRSV